MQVPGFILFLVTFLGLVVGIARKDNLARYFAAGRVDRDEKIARHPDHLEAIRIKSRLGGFRLVNQPHHPVRTTHHGHQGKSGSHHRHHHHKHAHDRHHDQFQVKA